MYILYYLPVRHVTVTHLPVYVEVTSSVKRETFDVDSPIVMVDPVAVVVSGSTVRTNDQKSINKTHVLL